MGFGEIILSLVHNAEKFCCDRMGKTAWNSKGLEYSKTLGNLAGKINQDCFIASGKNFVALQIDNADDDQQC